MPSLGEKIRRLRRAKGWSQKELAERALLSPETVYAVENGKRKPYRTTICLLA
ncbi:MAG: helix-turn-helix domain-containing protein, partial [Nitrospinota bacterium]